MRNVPAAVKRKAYEEYGITSHRPGEYEVDHLVSLELGGSNSLRNLWPQSFETQLWNARVKDQIENELHQEICEDEIDIKTAQREIATDWIASYKKHFHTDVPLSDRDAAHRNGPGGSRNASSSPQTGSPASSSRKTASPTVSASSVAAPAG